MRFLQKFASCHSRIDSVDGFVRVRSVGLGFRVQFHRKKWTVISRHFSCISNTSQKDIQLHLSTSKNRAKLTHLSAEWKKSPFHRLSHNIDEWLFKLQAQYEKQCRQEM